MSFLKECSRSAAISFSPVGPYLAAGTVAGVIDMNFSTTSALEVFSTDYSAGGKELRVAGGPTSAPERFQRLAWGALGSNNGTHKEGVIAGGLADGNILVWDAAKVVGAPAAPDGGGTHVSKLLKHIGPVRGLQFNSLNSPHLLASGGSDSEINVWNLTDLRRASSHPAAKTGANGQTANAEISTLAWNHLADHILASAASGMVTVWDLKQQRPRSVLRDENRNARRCSSVGWHPSVATQIVVAYEDDNHPVMQLWDLRQTVSYVHEFQGHHKGILGLSWCKQDPTMLLSTGKDSRTILWDVSGRELAEFSTPSFNFDVQWSPTNAGTFATSSYGGGNGQDGTVTLHSLASFAQPVQDFSNGYGEASAPLARVPAWLKRPVGATFGFGGKLASFTNEKRKTAEGTFNVNQISIRQVTTEQELVERSQRFEAAISGGEKTSLVRFCQDQEQQSSPEEAETWKFLRVHFEDDARRDLMAHLGFEGMLPTPEPAIAADVGVAAEQLDNLVVGSSTPQPLPQPEGDGTDFFENEGAGDFFEEPQQATPKAAGSSSLKTATPKGSPRAAKEQPGDKEDEIQKALFVGNFGAALDACLEAGRMADALIIGHMGQGHHLIRAQTEYMKRQPRPYMRLVKAVLDNDLLSLVKSRPLSAWRETLALLTSYSDGEEWAGLCDALARRLASSGQTHAATLAWICAGNVDQTIRAWTQSLHQQGVTVSGLQSLMERSVVLGLGVQQETASPALAQLLSQYANILASQGRMGMALEYLDMIPGDTSGPTGILKDRIYHSRSADIPPNTPVPPYPFSEQPVADSSASEAPQRPAQTSTGSTSDFYSQNAYRTSGAYTGGGGSYSANTGTAYSQPPSQPSYQSYYGSQPSYDHGGQQGLSASAGYPVGGGSYAATSGPSTAPPTASAPPPIHTTYGAPKPASPHVYDQNSYGSAYEQSGYNTAFQQPSQPQIPQRPAQTAPPAAHWQPSAASAPHQDWGQQQQQQQPQQSGYPSVPAAQSIVPPANVFVPSRSAALSTPSQPPALFVPTSSAVSGSYGQPPAPSFVAPRPPGTPPAARAPPTPPAPTGPPANINISTADTSKVPADAQGIVKTLRAVYDRCAPAAAGAPGKRRELEDTGRRLGQLLWRLNNDDLSPRVKSSLRELCLALDAKDFATASQKQVALTSSDWDECSTFLTGLKRLIKAAQALP